MGSLLIKNADVVITMNEKRSKIFNGGIFVRDTVIEQVGETPALTATADKVIDARGMVVLPGLVNTHHHFFQSLFRAVPGAQGCGRPR